MGNNKMVKLVKTFLVESFGLERIQNNFTVEEPNLVSFRIGNLSFGIYLDTLKVIQFEHGETPFGNTAVIVSSSNVNEYCQIIERSLKNYVREYIAPVNAGTMEMQKEM